MLSKNIGKAITYKELIINKKKISQLTCLFMKYNAINTKVDNRKFNDHIKEKGTPKKD
jgi:hypothetical protein